jgi:nucleotidyltransferase/DNA polymerase involved in DNA repair
MSRIAYLRIPQLPIAVHLKHKELKGKPFALIAGKLSPGGYNRARIFMCSPQASQKRVTVGMHLSEAKSICANLILKERDDVAYINAQKQLARGLLAYSPKVTSHNLGEFSLDASGLFYVGGESKFCHNVLKLCANAGFYDAQIGIADTMFTAKIASKSKSKKFYIIPPDYDIQFLAPLSIAHLELDQEIEEALIDLGIKSMEQFTKLPINSVVERFGQSGKLAHELARGIDLRQPTLPLAPKQFKSSVNLGGAVSSLDETVFALKSMLNQLTEELKEAGLWAEELQISFYNEDDKFDERLIPLIHPSNQTKFLLDVLKLSLEIQQLEREFTQIKLYVTRSSKEAWKQTPIAIPTITPIDKNNELSSSLFMLLQRLMIRIGKYTAAQAVASDHYDLNDIGAWVPVVQNSSLESTQHFVLPINTDYLNKMTEKHEQITPDLILRKCTDKSNIFVETRNDFPTAINYQKQWYRVKHITVPEYLSSTWWEEHSTKTYYKAIIESSKSLIGNTDNDSFIFILISHNHNNGRWYIEGFFD